MKKYSLVEDHQGIPANTVFEGPKVVPGSTKNGYYPIGEDPESTFCFWQQYVESQPDLFKEITQTT